MKGVSSSSSKVVVLPVLSNRFVFVMTQTYQIIDIDRRFQKTNTHD